MFIEKLSRIWKGSKRRHQATPNSRRNEDAELAELAALIESGDTSPDALERIAKLLGQDDRSELSPA